MKIERIAEMELTHADDAAIGQLLDRAVGQAEFDGRSYFQNRHHLRLVVRDQDTIIGHLAICLRAVRMGDMLLQAAGIAEVATDPDHRGKGIASALLAEALDAGRQSLADVCILFGNAQLYAANGFMSKPNPTLTVSMHGVRTGEHESRAGDGLMIYPLRDLNWDDAVTLDLVGFAF